MRQVTIILCFLVCSFLSIAQESASIVSLIGDDEKGYEQMTSECPSLLLEVAGNSMDSAYKVWTGMLSDIENSASVDGIDIKGSKIWINLFWNSDGSIDKIFYYPKPNSKNMDFTLVTKALENFAKDYYLPIEHSECFSHYGSASFPTHTKLVTPNEK